jgi:hypothetical protein
VTGDKERAIGELMAKMTEGRVDRQRQARVSARERNRRADNRSQEKQRDRGDYRPDDYWPASGCVLRDVLGSGSVHGKLVNEPFSIFHFSFVICHLSI